MVKKNNSLNAMPPLSVVRGLQVDATYTEQEVPEFKGNPLLEALPPLWTKENVAQRLSYYPFYDMHQRWLSDEVRFHILENCREFFIPQGIHYEIHLSISNMIRRSYIYRNPAEQAHWGKHSEKIEQLEHGLQRGSFLRSKARGFAIVGVGGVGKSTAVENILSHYPQVITHTWYKGSDLIVRQLVWVKLQCPSDGSLKSLCLNYIQEVDDILGTTYMRLYGGIRRTVDELLLTMARIASNHYQGVLVLDEIQDLSDAKGGGASRMLNFFVQMENTLGIPFVLIGTPKVKELFAGEFRQARRISEQGDIVWRPMREIAEKEKDADPDKADPEWNAFIRAMWKYWYLKKDHPLPGEKLRNQASGASSAVSLSEDDKEKFLLEDSAVRTLYKESQGITAVVVTIFFLAQRRAITSGKEDVTPAVIRHAVRDNQHYIKWMLERLREGRWKPIGRKKISDLDVSEARPFETVKPNSGKSDRAKKDAGKTGQENSNMKQNDGKTRADKAGGKRKSPKAAQTYAPDDLRRLHSKDNNEAIGNASSGQPDNFASSTEFLD